jgi:spore coat polysaccharide biosynthesis predicted glycosyltransferase SpsG
VTERIVVRCDVGPAIGVGHVMRCLALAEEFATRGYAVDFCADLASVPFAAAQVAARGFGHVAPPDDPHDEVAHLLALRPRLVVLDSYRLPASVYAALEERVPTLALVDGDPAGRRARIYLDQNLGAERDDWSLPRGAVRLAGLDYALMREDVLRMRPQQPREDVRDVPEVFAVFGGTDAFGAGPVLAAALVATGVPFSLTVVAGQPALREQLEQITAGVGQVVAVVPPVDDVAARAAAADVVLSAAGTSTWELLCVGASCALVCVADNQAESYRRVLDRGLAAGLGYLSDIRQDRAGAVSRLRSLMQDPDGLRQRRTRGWQMVDGQGRERVVAACEAAGVLG